MIPSQRVEGRNHIRNFLKVRFQKYSPAKHTPPPHTHTHTNTHTNTLTHTDVRPPGSVVYGSVRLRLLGPPLEEPSAEETEEETTVCNSNEESEAAAIVTEI